MVRYVQVNNNLGPISAEHDSQYLAITGQNKSKMNLLRCFEKSQQHLTNTVGEKERKQAHLLIALPSHSEGLSFFLTCLFLLSCSVTLTCVVKGMRLVW